MQSSRLPTPSPNRLGSPIGRIALLLLVPVVTVAAQDVQFQGRVQSGGGGYYNFVHFADLDLDGRRDELRLYDNGTYGLVFAHRNAGNAVREYLPVATGFWFGPTAAAVGDLDGDGDADLAIAEGVLYVFPNLGNGVYGSAWNPLSYASRAVEIADLDGDGDPDILTLNAQQMHVVINQGTGTFTLASSVSVGVSESGLAVGDFDGDGDIDAAVTSAGEDRVSVLSNQGNGTFAPRVPYLVGLDPAQARAADVDGDLDLDLVVANGGSGSVSILLNAGNGAFAPAVSHATAPASEFLEVADLNGDGLVDLALHGTSGTGVLLNQGAGSFTPYVGYGAGSYGSLAAFDVDDDGDLDLSRAGRYALLNRGDGSFSEPPRVPLLTTIDWDTAIRVGDLEGDGDLDVVHVNSLHLVTRSNLGGGSFGPPVTIPASLGSYVELELVDMDADGDLDAIAGSNSGFNNEVRYFPNIGAGTFGAGIDLLNSLAQSPWGLGTADLSGDGLPEVFIRVGSTIQRSPNLGGGTFGPFTAVALASGSSGAWDVADVDGDGDTDIVSLSPDVVEWNENVAGVFAPPVLVASIPGASDIVARDFDLDGDADVAVTATSGVEFVMNLGAGTFASPVVLGVHAGELSSDDVDHDGDPDLVCRSTDGAGNVAVYESLGGGAFAPASRFGTANAYDVAGLDTDLDGDDDFVALNRTDFFTLENTTTSGVAFCFGDGSGTACPCGNASSPAAKAGCTNGLGRAGRIVARGSTSLLVDSLELRGTGMTNSAALYFQGTLAANGGNGNVFGDGLRCAGGSVVRLDVVQNAQGASIVPGAGDPPLRVLGQITSPGERVYQVWYRDAGNFCTPATWNLTNGVRMLWKL